MNPKVEKKTVPSVVMPTAVEDDLDGTAKRKKGEEKWRPMPAPAPEIPLKSPGDGKLPRPGRFWRVVGAPKDGLKVWQGVSETSPIFPGTLPQGAVVEEVQVVGNRLSFTDFSMRGPPSGWVNIRENGRDMLVIDTEGSQDLLPSAFVLILVSPHTLIIQVVPGQAGGGSFQKNKPIGNGHVAG